MAAALLLLGGLAVAGRAAGAPAARTETAVESIPVPYPVQARSGPLARARSKLVEFETAPFPYHGLVPRTNKPFLDVDENGRRGHRTGAGRIYWEDETYSDRQVLLHLPKGFDIRRPSLLIVFFHGHGAKLADDVYLRQQVPAQISASGINAALVAPQLAFNAADSSAGKFWEPGAFARFLGEAAQYLARLHGDPRSVRSFASMPVVIVAYSGGYLTTASCVHHGGIGNRLRGVVLFDALYGELDTFADWVARQKSAFFVSTYTHSTQARNDQLQKVLAGRHIPVATSLEPRLRPGSVAFLPAPKDADHRDFLTYAWVDDPLKDLLDRLKGYTRR
ncbi:MAG: alpha/beta hydrolase [Hyphomicrobiaceae bacterium]|nr:alpha/beta hydrolase [Hyphomicrobiaceae bacterium]